MAVIITREADRTTLRIPQLDGPKATFFREEGNRWAKRMVESISQTTEVDSRTMVKIHGTTIEVVQTTITTTRTMVDMVAISTSIGT